MVVRIVGRQFSAFEAAIAAVAGTWDGVVETSWMPLPRLEHTVSDLDADLAMVPSDWVARLARDRVIRPVEPLDTTVWSRTFVDGVTWGGRMWGQPIHDGPQVLVYRTDLFADPVEQRGYAHRHGVELEPARTWAEFERQAEWFTRPEQGRWGTVLAGLPDGHSDVYDFVVQLRRFGGDVLDDSGAPAFGGEAGIRAIGWLRRMRAFAPPGAETVDSVESGSVFGDGHGALMLNWAGLADLANSGDGPASGLVGCALAPRGTVTVNAFWVLVHLSRGSTREPVEFLRHAALAASDRLVSLAGASGARLSTWSDPEVLAGFAPTALFAEAHRTSRTLPVVPELPALVDAISAAVDAAVNRGEPAGPALARATAELR